ARRRGGPGPGLHRDDLRGSLLAGTDRARAGRLKPGHRPGSAGDVGAHPAPVPVSPRGSGARHGRNEPGRRRSGRARGPVPRARLAPPRAAATLSVLRFTDLSASGICILWITFRCGGRNAFWAGSPTFSSPPFGGGSWLSTIAVCSVGCRGVSIKSWCRSGAGARRSRPPRVVIYREAARRGWVVMSTVVAASPPFDGDDEDGRDGLGDVAAEAFLASLPPHLREVRARQELTRRDLPRRGGSIEEPQLSAATQRVWDAQVQEARALAEKHRALAELYQHDGEYEEVTELDSVDTTRAALALRIIGSAAGWQLRDGYQAVHLFPRCLAALGEGDMPSAWFQKMLRSSRALSDASRRKLDIAVASWSVDISPERFFTLLKKLITLLEQREQRPDPLSCLTRTVELLPSTEPGMGTIQIHGPIPEILAQWKRLDESARAVQQAQRTALWEGTPIPHDPDDRVRETGRALPLGELRFALLSGAGLDSRD